MGLRHESCGQAWRRSSSSPRHPPCSPCSSPEPPDSPGPQRGLTLSSRPLGSGQLGGAATGAACREQSQDGDRAGHPFWKCLHFQTAVQTPKLARQASIELPSMAASSTKSWWETGEVQAQSAAKTPSCKDIVAGDMSKKSLWEQKGGSKTSSTIKHSGPWRKHQTNTDGGTFKD
ncbi:uncharacterized protein LOC134807782 [Pan troglodytes]|uniref:uncharacterized protein LOC134807782 n=1 Tax=Pan troglodytes TaxID=9598 RepID=UPI000511CA87